MSARAVTMSPAAIRALARFWFLRGFRCSGYSCHGEMPRLRESGPFTNMLDAEFTRQWAERHRPEGG